MEEQNTTENFKITEQIARELRWYLMVASPVPVHPNSLVIPILSFDLDSAVTNVNLVKPPNNFVSYCGNRLVSELLQELASKGYDFSGTPRIEPIYTPPMETIQIKPTHEQFIERLMLVAEEYCEPQDKLALLDILNRAKKIKVGEGQKIIN